MKIGKVWWGKENDKGKMYKERMNVHLSNIVQASISSHAIFHLLIRKIQHRSKDWLEQARDNPMKSGDPDWAGMRTDGHSLDWNFSLQNPPQLYDLHHDVIPPQPTDSQDPHPPSTRTQNDFQTLLKKTFFKYKAVWVLFTDISHQLRGGPVAVWECMI